MLTNPEGKGEKDDKDQGAPKAVYTTPVLTKYGDVATVTTAKSLSTGPNDSLGTSHP